ncbi:MAG: sigma-70 family RNA polymerase sigma factor [Sandaracinaceae bacterium]|nr:sigma-70 family RNA polymerase sigma factor [Sandaracinaceae bacterium]
MARDKLVQAHVPLVAAIAGKYCRFGSQYEDLISEGILGLMRAAARYDAERNVRFSVYAAFWIRAFIRRYTLASRSIVGTPSTRGARRAIARLATTEREFRHKHGVEATTDQLASMLNVKPSEVHDAIAVLRHSDITLTTEPGALDIASDTPNAEELLGTAEEQRQVLNSITHVLRVLNGRDLLIAQKRLLADERTPLSAIGTELGISHERVRQLETRILERMRRALAEPARQVA